MPGASVPPLEGKRLAVTVSEEGVKEDESNKTHEAGLSVAENVAEEIGTSAE